MTTEDAQERIQHAFDLMDQAIEEMRKVLEEGTCSPGKDAFFCLIQEHDAADLAKRITAPVSPTRVLVVDKLPETAEERERILKNATHVCKCETPTDPSIDGLTCGKCGGWIV